MGGRSPLWLTRRISHFGGVLGSLFDLTSEGIGVSVYSRDFSKYQLGLKLCDRRFRIVSDYTTVWSGLYGRWGVVVSLLDFEGEGNQCTNLKSRPLCIKTLTTVSGRN